MFNLNKRKYARGFTQCELKLLTDAHIYAYDYAPAPGQTDEDILQETSGEVFIEKLGETDRSLFFLSVSAHISHVVAVNKMKRELYDDAIQIE